MQNVLIASLLLLCICPSAFAQGQLVKNASYALKSSSIIQGGGSPSVDLSASQTIGFFQFEFTNPLYFKLDGQCNANPCTSRSVRNCCVECISNNGVTGANPLNPKNNDRGPTCYCAKQVFSVCVDLECVVPGSYGTWSQYSDAARLLGGYTSSAHHGGGGSVTTGGGFSTSRTLARDEIHYYEFASAVACTNLLLTVMTLSGDQNVYANTVTYPSVQAGAVSATDAGNHHHHEGSSDPFAGVVSNSTTQTGITGNISASSISPGYDWYSNAWSTRRMSDSIVFCASNSVPYTMPFGMDPATSKLNMVNDLGQLTNTYFIAVHGYLPGDYVLRFEAAPAATPQFLLNTVEYYHLTSALRHLHCGENQYAVYGLPPSNDPGFSYFAIQSAEQPLNLTTMNTTLHRDIFAFALDVSLTINGVTTVLFDQDLSTCKMNFSHGRVWYDENGNNVANTVDAFVLAAPSCDYDQLKLSYEGLVGMIDNISNANTLDKISQGIMGGAMWSTSNAWIGCESFVKSHLLLAYNVDNTIENTARCYAQPGAPEYATDPCCNATLLFSTCCSARTIPITTQRFVPLDQRVTSECRNDECSMQAATEFAQVANSLQDSRVGCDAVADSVSQDPGFKDTQIDDCFARYTAECGSDLDCPSDTYCNATTGHCAFPASFLAITTCAVADMSAELKIPLAITLGVPPNSADSVLANALHTNYRVTGCDQPLQVVAATSTRDWISDYNATICALGGQFCNWDEDPNANRANASCVGTLWRTTNYCYSPAGCNSLVPKSCPELSEFPGCFTNLTTQSECTLNGGLYDVNEVGTVHVCWLKNENDTTCKDATLCDPAEDICQPFCYVTTIASTDCDCAQYASNSSSTYYAICNKTNTALTYDAAKGTPRCVVSKEVYNGTIAGCAGVLGGGTSWYRGAHYQAASLNDPLSCTAGGVCSAVGVTAATACATATACTVSCPGCDSVACAAKGECSDDYVNNGAACVMDPVPDTFGQPSCTAMSGVAWVLYPLGCVDSSTVPMNQSTCSTMPGTQWYTRQLNASACTAIQRCRELRNSQFIYTLKSEAECTGCRGSYEPIFKWANGVASAAQWTSNVWGSRARSSANKFGVSLWNSSAAAEAVSRVYLARYAQLAKTYLACQYGSLASYLSLLSCDCASDLSRCYKNFQPVLLGVTRICSGANVTNLLAPAQMMATAETIFTAGCANIEVSLIPAGRFRRGSANIYSSLFLDSIQTNEWAVIENKNEVVVGQLIGNGIQFELDTTANPGLQLCIEIRSDIGVFAPYTAYDFGVLSANFKKFRAVYATNATVKQNLAGVESVCVSVSESGNYFPIRRFPNAKNAKFSDTLSKQQKAAFYAGVAIYVICWLFATYRLVSLFLWTMIRPTDSSGQVKTAHPLMVPRIAMGLLSFFFFLRWLYFILVPAGVMIKAPLIIDILMAELPTYFFITIFSLLVLWWVELYHRTSARKSFLGGMKWVFIGVNLALYLFLLVVIIIYAATENNNGVGVCSTASRSTKTADTVAKVYKVFVSTIAFILAAGFMIYGIRLFLMVVGVSGSLDRIVKFVLISTVCSLGLLLQCALLLYSTFKPASRKTDTALAISFTLVVEVLPGLVLIAFMRQPELAGLTWYQDLAWCLYADRDVAMSGAGASKSYQSSKRSVTSTSGSMGSLAPNSGVGSGSNSGSDLAVGPSSINSRL